MDEFIRDVCPQAVKGKDDQVNRVAEAVRGYLDDGEGDLPLDGLDLDVCGEFQKKVLHLNRQIPRGMVATYSGLAKRLHMPQAARAVGNAQARNPFPIVIPCHRVVRSSGALGGFGGGLEMKRKLLDLEGVTFDAAGNVRPAHFWR
jgi:methylated-DNA-[protein]-cysteine S-methyltransferase